MRRPQCLRSRVGSIRSLHGPTGGDHGRVWAMNEPAGTVGGCASCPLAGGTPQEITRYRPCGIRAAPCQNLRRLIRGEHQVPDQADQDQREGSAAQQGRQVLPQDRDPQGP
ncbi:hypothetical protein CP976_14940 [Streptomyces coeruleorubidus]|uniref:Uncharacterized protein n=1 Tax=Streptomyces coeruleorubidus TaxID=116188 RepID=A0A5J6I2B4_STRC4|nr:hypothetical protein CP976_14940 [Streptomyces coeruleorubidus]